MTFLVSLPPCSKCAPLVLRASAAASIQKCSTDPSAADLPSNRIIFVAGVFGFCFHEARPRSGIATRGRVARAAAIKLNTNGNTKKDANGKAINGKTNGNVKPKTDGHEAYKEITFKVPSSLLELLPPKMRSADALGERDRYLSTSLEIGLKASAQAGVNLDVAGLLNKMQDCHGDNQSALRDVLTSVDKGMSEIKIALHMNEKLDVSRGEAMDAKDAGHAKGLVFEEAGYNALVDIASIFGDTVEHTGSVPAKGTKSKVGDHVIHINVPGAGDLRLVVEQKAGASCGRKQLLEQMTEAMRNRQAQAAIGLVQRKVWSKRHSGYELISPKQMIVGVDYSEHAEETDSDWFALEVAYRTLRFHVVNSEVQSHTGGVQKNHIAEVNACIRRVQGELNAMRVVRGNVTAAHKSLDAIVSTVRKLEDNVREELAEMEKLLPGRGGARDVQEKNVDKRPSMKLRQPN